MMTFWAKAGPLPTSATSTTTIATFVRTSSSFPLEKGMVSALGSPL